MFRGAICPPFRARYVWHYPYPLDEVMMQQVAAFVEGEHDFTSFAAVDPERGRDQEVSNVRNISVPSGAPGRRIGLHRPRKRIPAPHGAQPGGTLLLAGKGRLKPFRASADSCSPLPLCRRSHGTGKRPVPAERRVLTVMISSVAMISSMLGTFARNVS